MNDLGHPNSLDGLTRFIDACKKDRLPITAFHVPRLKVNINGHDLIWQSNIPHCATSSVHEKNNPTLEKLMYLTINIAGDLLIKFGSLSALNNNNLLNQCQACTHGASTCYHVATHKRVCHISPQKLIFHDFNQNKFNKNVKETQFFLKSLNI